MKLPILLLPTLWLALPARADSWVASDPPRVVLQQVLKQVNDARAQGRRCGRAPKDRVREAGYRPRLTGENIAFAPESAAEVVRGWLASPGHCANIMDARFSETGLGLALGAQRGYIYWVQTFGSPAVR